MIASVSLSMLVVILVAISVDQQHDLLTREWRTRAKSHATDVAEAISVPLAVGDRDEVSRLLRAMCSADTDLLRVMVRDDRERLAAELNGRAAPTLGDASFLMRESTPVRLDERTVGRVDVTLSTRRLGDEAKVLVEKSATAGGLVGIVTLVLFLFGLRAMVVDPIERIAKATREVRDGTGPDLPARLSEGNDEIGVLARDLIATAEVLEARRKGLVEAADHLNNIHRTMPGALFVIDSNGAIESVNEAGLAMFEYAEQDLIGQPMSVLFAPDDPPNLDVFRGVIETREVLRKEKSGRTRSGKTMSMLLSATALSRKGEGSSSSLICVALDISERKRLEAELRQAQKLESVGTLAAGVAHEINTPVQFVSDSVHFVRDALLDLFGLIERYRAVCGSGGSREKITADIAEAEEAADLSYVLENVPKAIDRSLDGLERVATIVRSLKEFAHPDQRDKASVNLNRAVSSTLTIARNEYKYVAELETDLSDVPPVMCYAGELNQVILNLVVNAAHAIADKVKGTTEKGLIKVRTWADDSHVFIAIGDSGTGIPEPIRDKIFDPFFTTKEVGRGSGQGLAMARSVIVDKHGGTLTFETEVGKGTTFLVRLPIGSTALGTPAIAA